MTELLPEQKLVSKLAVRDYIPTLDDLQDALKLCIQLEAEAVDDTAKEVSLAIRRVSTRLLAQLNMEVSSMALESQ